MKELILFIGCFCLIYLVYYLLIINRKNKLDKITTSAECRYLRVKYNIDIDKIPIKTLAKHIAIINSFIMSVAVSVICSDMFKLPILIDWLLRFLVGIIVLMIMIMIMYSILGKYYLRKYQGGKRNV